MKEILEKIKKKLEEIDDNVQFGEDDFWNEEEIIYAIRKIIQKHEEEQANKTVYERVKEERDELKERLDKLNRLLDKVFIEHTAFISETQAHYLKEQREYMQGYLDTLDKRLEDLQEQNGRVDNEIFRI